MKLALCPRLLMCSRPFRPLGFAHLCRSRPRGSVHLLLPWRLYVDHSHCPRACASYPSCVAVYPRDSRSRRVLCRSSHSLHSQGWCRLNHVDAAIPNRSARLTLPLVHLSSSLLLSLPQSGVIFLDALTKLLPMPSQGMSPIALDRQSLVATSHRKVFSRKPPA